ncbi:hypothetical protein [Mediterraneibacter gnavus]|uniref:hypothetical protein n=1 Tax=Mediterraneibacter gnavus TaxID=33038 RepID=UPI003561F767
MEDKKTYIASFSGGKDSMATIILAHEHKEPLDMIIFAEVMFDEQTSGELPEHISFIKERCVPLFREWGYETKILHAEKTYMELFNHVITNSKVESRNGKKQGFPMMGKCAVNRDCKVKPINQFLKQFDQTKIVQYLGIAADEPKRLERLRGTNKISLLEKYGYTEKMAFELCEKYNLLSPIYDFTKRGGCWFCPNARYFELKHLRSNHRDLWKRLLDLEDEENLVANIWNMLTGRSMKDNEEMFFWEEAQMNIYDFLEE